MVVGCEAQSITKSASIHEALDSAISAVWWCMLVTQHSRGGGRGIRSSQSSSGSQCDTSLSYITLQGSKGGNYIHGLRLNFDSTLVGVTSLFMSF